MESLSLEVCPSGLCNSGGVRVLCKEVVSEKRYENYPILYLPFHGNECEIALSDETCELDDIADMLENKCASRVIIFGACSTLHTDMRRIKYFLWKTEALAVCGYRTDVGWMLSTAFELLLLEAMQGNEFSQRGIPAIRKRAEELGKRFKELDFRIVTSRELQD